MVLSSKSVFELFCNIFPQFGSEENITYFPRGNNTIKIEFKNPNYPTLIFHYESKKLWKISTIDIAEEEDEKVQELREQLSIQQKMNYNMKRRKT